MINKKIVDSIKTNINVKGMLALPLVIDNDTVCSSAIDGMLVTTIIRESDERTRIYMSGTNTYFVTTLDFDKLLDMLDNIHADLFFFETEEGEAHSVTVPPVPSEEVKDIKNHNFGNKIRYDIKFKYDHN